MTDKNLKSKDVVEASSVYIKKWREVEPVLRGTEKGDAAMYTEAGEDASAQLWPTRGQQHPQQQGKYLQKPDR